MSSSTVSTPNASATLRLRSRVSSDESRSGMRTATTFSGPNALAQSPATVLLSMPPESATTAPRLRSLLCAASFRSAQISSTRRRIEVEHSRRELGSAAHSVSAAFEVT